MAKTGPFCSGLLTKQNEDTPVSDEIRKNIVLLSMNFG